MSTTEEPSTVALQEYLGDLVEALDRRSREQLLVWRDFLASTRALYLSTLTVDTPGAADLMADTDYQEALIGIVDEILKWKEVPDGNAA